MNIKPEDEPEDPDFDEDPEAVEVRTNLAMALSRSMKNVERLERELEGIIICLNGFHSDLEMIFSMKRNLVHESEEVAEQIAKTVLQNMAKTRKNQYLEKRTLLGK